MIRAIAMAFTLTVGGLDVIDANLPAPVRRAPSRWMPRCSCAACCASRSRTARASTGRRCTRKSIAELDGVRVFGGNLTTVDEQDWGDYRGIWCLCEAADFGAILDTMLFNGVLPGITLRELVQDMVDQLLGAEGFTVHAAMADGPAIGPIGQGFTVRAGRVRQPGHDGAVAVDRHGLQGDPVRGAGAGESGPST